MRYLKKKLTLTILADKFLTFWDIRKPAQTFNDILNFWGHSKESQRFENILDCCKFVTFCYFLTFSPILTNKFYQTFFADFSASFQINIFFIKSLIQSVKIVNQSYRSLVNSTSLANFNSAQKATGQVCKVSVAQL